MKRIKKKTNIYIYTTSISYWRLCHIWLVRFRCGFCTLSFEAPKPFELYWTRWNEWAYSFDCWWITKSKEYFIAMLAHNFSCDGMGLDLFLFRTNNIWIIRFFFLSKNVKCILWPTQRHCLAFQIFYYNYRICVHCADVRFMLRWPGNIVSVISNRTCILYIPVSCWLL